MKTRSQKKSEEEEGETSKDRFSLGTVKEVEDCENKKRDHRVKTRSNSEGKHLTLDVVKKVKDLQKKPREQQSQPADGYDNYNGYDDNND